MPRISASASLDYKRPVSDTLTATARVEGDIIHKTIAIESGAHFEGSVQRQEDPLNNGGTKKLAPPTE